MRRIQALSTLFTVVVLLSCSRGSEGFPQVAGWTRVSEVSVYDADDLWEYIDGAAELFVTYGVRTCRTADLSAGGVTVTVDLYDLDTPLNAFGIFDLEGSGHGAPFPGALEAVIAPPYQALLVKGAVYVKVNAVEGELTDRTGQELLAGIARALPGGTAYPGELGLLPREGRITGSEGYQAEGFLGLTELTRCVHAEYSDEGGRNWLGFLMFLPSGSPTPWTEGTGGWASLEYDGRVVHFREVPYRGLVGLVRTEQGFLGVSGSSDRADLLRRLTGLLPQSR
jgi:hypothetical protein